jgi:hypothetical protein
MPSSASIPFAQAMQRHSGGWQHTPRPAKENGGGDIPAAPGTSTSAAGHSEAERPSDPARSND